MDNELKTLQEILDDIALKAIMLTPGNLVELGELLSKIEEVMAYEDTTLPAAVKKIGGGLKLIIEKIILGELPDTDVVYEKISQAISILQDICREKDQEQAGASLKNFNGLLKELNLADTEVQTAGQDDTTMEEEATPEVSVTKSKPVIDITQDKELLAGFISESMEHLEQIEVDILSLEQSPDDKDCINTIFRPFHTIKGVSGFLNLQDINKLAHETENILDKARNGELSISSEIIDLILDACDVLKRMIMDIKTALETGTLEQKDYDLDSFINRIRAAQEGVVGEEATLPEPKLVGEILVKKGVADTEAIDKALEKQRDSGEKIGEIIIREAAVKPKEVAHALREQKAMTSIASAGTANSAVKVDIGKLDNLVDMVGELVITQSLIWQNSHVQTIRDQKLMRDFSQLSRITTDLQKTAMSLRMVPIKQTLQKMIRLVRDLAKKSEKQADLQMSGEDTEIDRNMVDAIYDPLVHMIRNSIDHGIEMPDERATKGKPATGTIWLRAYQKGGNIVIEIEDDGQGLNREKILKKAKEKGLIKNTEGLSTFEIDNLIFQAGFSTADKITDVSGRGVGMDVVKKAIEKLRGKVEISSRPGQGSTFTIKVPLTLAIIDGIIVKVGVERYIVPTVVIKETIRPRQEEYSTVHGKGEMIKVRGNLIPLVRLYKMFDIDAEHKDPCESLVVVVENEGRQKCLLVDDLLGKQEVVIKSLGDHMKNVRGLAGGTILGDGKVGLILDINGIFSVAEEQNLGMLH
ncbi:MAG: chemotaxis protein CheA [Desulfovibrionales bacterium]|nr:chemotaxis protein CheA [Desulfovibrionales bacterium]